MGGRHACSRKHAASLASFRKERCCPPPILSIINGSRDTECVSLYSAQQHLFVHTPEILSGLFIVEEVYFPCLFFYENNATMDTHEYLSAQTSFFYFFFFHTNSMENILSTERRMRVLTVGASALCGLYLLVAFVAEPMRGFAAAASDNDNKVSTTVSSAITLSCTDENSDSNSNDNNLTLGTITVNGDTGAYSTLRDYRCIVTTNDSAGYTLAWRVDTGSGGTATGYMINQFADKIAPFKYNNTNGAETDALAWAIDASDAEWGARLSSTSDSFTEDHASRQITSTEWGGAGSDGGANEDYARVASGSSVIFASSTNETVDAGDNVYIGFRTAIGATRYQPTGTYEVLVDFTATTTN